MYRNEIIDKLEQLPDVEIGDVTDEICVVYDNHTGKFFQYEFCMTEKKLVDKIYLSPNIPQKFLIDREKLASYLWNNVDRNAFLTLECLSFVVDEHDYSVLAKRFRCCDPDDFAKRKELGIMWFDHNVCIVDVTNIAKLMKANEKDNILYRTRRDIIVTAVHELRHLMLDTNIVLSFDDYPLHLGDEEMVEEYAQEVVCNNNEWENVFIGG